MKNKSKTPAKTKNKKAKPKKIKYDPLCDLPGIIKPDMSRELW